MAESIKNLLQKLHAIMSEVDRIEKDSESYDRTYTYSSEKVIKETLHPLFVKHKVLLILGAQEVNMQDTMSSSGPGRITTVKFNYRFFDIETGESIEDSFVGSGNGRDDKGVYAAVTGAIKYIITSTFLIPTGDDPENTGDDDQDKAPVVVAACETTEQAPDDGTEFPPSEESEPLPTSPEPPKTTGGEPGGPTQLHPFGTPQGAKMSNNDYKKTLAAFAKYDVSEEDLEKRSGYPVTEWTLNMKEVAYDHYLLLKDNAERGEGHGWTKAQFMGEDGE